MNLELPDFPKFYKVGRKIYCEIDHIATAANLEAADGICRALNQLDDICIVAKIPRPLKQYGKASND